MITKMLQDDRREWELLTSLLDAHPDEVLHESGFPPWVSRDVYAHLARWINYSNREMVAYCAGNKPSPPANNVEEMNLRWQREDSWMSLGEARKCAQEAFSERIRLIRSIPLDRWDKELEKTSLFDGAKHFILHRKYIRLA